MILLASVSSGILAIWLNKERRRAWTIADRRGCPVVRLTSSFRTWWYHLIPNNFVGVKMLCSLDPVCNVACGMLTARVFCQNHYEQSWTLFIHISMANSIHKVAECCKWRLNQDSFILLSVLYVFLICLLSCIFRGVPWRQPHRRSDLATLPSMGAIA